MRSWLFLFSICFIIKILLTLAHLKCNLFCLPQTLTNMKKLKTLFIIIAVIFLTAAVHGQSLKRGNIIGIHEWKITLNGNVTRDQFEKFMLEEYIPALEKKCPGLNVILMKGERGNIRCDYGIIFHFKTLESRNEWFPNQGIRSEKGKIAMEKVKPFSDKLHEMVQIESTYTDWIIL